MSSSPSIIISGAGVGGLTLAIALQRRGIFARVFERTPKLLPAGAGLAIQPNAMKVLLALDIGDEVAAAGHAVGRAAMLDARGRLLGREQDMAALSAPFGAPVLAIHRARLHDILLNALAPATVELGTEVVDYEMRGGHPIVRLADGATEHADILVGADGLRSKVRARMIDDGEPRYSGYTSWRGVTTAGGVRLDRMSESWGRGERFGMVDIGHGEVYWFAVANAPAHAEDGKSSSRGTGDNHDVRAELLGRPVWELVDAPGRGRSAVYCCGTTSAACAMSVSTRSSTSVERPSRKRMVWPMTSPYSSGVQ